MSVAMDVTPRPWVLSEAADAHFVYLEDAAHTMAIRVRIAKVGDGRFILRAVNTHDALVKALQRIVDHDTDEDGRIVVTREDVRVVRDALIEARVS